MSSMLKYFVFGLVLLCLSNYLQSVRAQIGGVPPVGINPQNQIDPEFGTGVQPGGMNPTFGAGVPPQGGINPELSHMRPQVGVIPTVGAGGFENPMNHRIRRSHRDDHFNHNFNFHQSNRHDFHQSNHHDFHRGHDFDQMKNFHHDQLGRRNKFSRPGKHFSHRIPNNNHINRISHNF